MKREPLLLLIISFFLLLSTDGFSQVGIGTTTPDPSSVLDITATDKGVSIPNVNLASETDAAKIPNPKPGLMVYNINTALPCGKGLYFNNGTAAAPFWSCFTKTTREFHAYNTNSRNNVNSATLTLQPGCTINFTVPAGQIVDVKIDAVLGGLNSSTSSGQYSVFDTVVYVDGAPLPQGGWNRTSVVNPGSNTNSFNVCSISTVWNGVTAGAHTIQLYSSRPYGNSSITLGGDCTTATNCGEIHATVIYR